VNNKKLILASGSPYRHELLERLGVAFEVWSPDIDESPAAGEGPSQTAVRLARAKAEAAARVWPAAWIIGSDQVADHGGRHIGKPGTLENARAQLRAMSGATVHFHTALCLLGPGWQTRSEALVTTTVTFRVLTQPEIERYLEREDALDCAGSAKSEGLGIALLDRLEGDDPTALVGLPLIALSRLLRAEGFEVP
jgi:septum formation protein